MQNLIYKKMPIVMSEVGAIEKSKSGSGINYKFRSIDQFMNHLNPVMAKHGVGVLPNIIEQSVDKRDVVSSYNGQEKTVVWTTVYLKMSFTFFAEDGSTLVVTTIGEGRDNSDKSYNKAMSAALKYALMQTFLVPTEDLTDGDFERPEVIDQKPAQTKQKLATPPTSKIREQINKAKNNAEAMKEPPKVEILDDKIPEDVHNKEKEQLVTYAQRQEIFSLADKNNYNARDIQTHIENKYKIKSSSDITLTQYKEIRNDILSGNIINGTSKQNL